MDHDRLYASDAEIIDAFFARDEEAIEKTRSKYGKLFRSIACSLLKNTEDAEECVSDAYLRLWNAIPPAKPTDLRAYGSKITRNICLDRIDRSRAKKRADEAFLTELSETIPAPDGDPAGSDVELSEEIDTFLRGIDRADRVLFVLRYFFGQSYDELSEHCGVTKSRVRSRLHAIRIKLKKHLEKEGFSL